MEAHLDSHAGNAHYSRTSKLWTEHIQADFERKIKTRSPSKFSFSMTDTDIELLR